MDAARTVCENEVLIESSHCDRERMRVVRRRLDRALTLCLLALGAWLIYHGLSTQSDTPRFVASSKKISTFGIFEWARLDHNPTGEVDTSLGESIDPDNWRQLALTASKANGGRAEFVLARPLWWLEQRGAREGETIHIAVPECGIDGEATVHAIDPCPPIAPNPPPNARLVIGTFKHYGAAVVDLTYEAESPTGERITETLVTTPNHPFWSEDKQDYVRADALQPSETLRTLDGFAQVVSIKPRAEPETVYNIEVFGDHLYHVGEAGVVVHNALPCNGPGRVVNVIDNMLKTASRYQKQVAGLASGKAYKVDDVFFDGYKNGKLIEAKGPGYVRLIRDRPHLEEEIQERLIDQATRQTKAAKGTTVQWIVAEEQFARGLREVFDEIDEISVEVIHVSMKW